MMFGYELCLSIAGVRPPQSAVAQHIVYGVLLICALQIVYDIGFSAFG